MAAELLLEIGTEEIPSVYLEEGLNELRRLAEACLRENRIEIKKEAAREGQPLSEKTTYYMQEFLLYINTVCKGVAT